MLTDWPAVNTEALTVIVVAPAAVIWTRAPASAATSVWLAVFAFIGSSVIALSSDASSTDPATNGNGVAIVPLS